MVVETLFRSVKRFAASVNSQAVAMIIGFA